MLAFTLFIPACNFGDLISCTFLNNKQHELFDQGGASAGGQVADGDDGQRNGHHHDRREYRFIFTHNSGALKASSGTV
jgi:hypothetical protein